MADPATRDQPAGDQHRTVGAAGTAGAAAGKKRGGGGRNKSADVSPAPPPPAKRKTKKTTPGQTRSNSTASNSATTSDIELVNSALGGVGTAQRPCLTRTQSKALGKRSSSAAVAASAAAPVVSQPSKKTKKKSTGARYSSTVVSGQVSAVSAENDTPAETGKRASGKKKAALLPFQGLLADVNCAQEVDSDTPLSDRLSIKPSPHSNSSGVARKKQRKQSPVAHPPPAKSSTAGSASSVESSTRRHALSVSVDVSQTVVNPPSSNLLGSNTGTTASRKSAAADARHSLGSNTSGSRKSAVETRNSLGTGTSATRKSAAAEARTSLGRNTSAPRKTEPRKRKHSEPPAAPQELSAGGRSLRSTEARLAFKVSLSNAKIDTLRRNQPSDSQQSQLQPSPAKKARPSSSSSSSADSASLLRRSSRCKLTTGSCASTSRSSSRGGGGRGGGVGGGATASTAATSTTSTSTGKTATLYGNGAATTGGGTAATEGDSMMSGGGEGGDGGGHLTAGGAGEEDKGQGSSSTPAAGVAGSSSLMSGAGGASSSGAAAGLLDSESEDSEVGRLQALLEARGLPPHLFGALGPRVQHLLHRSMGPSSTATKAQQLLVSLQATGDEDQQLQAVVEMCQMLVMGNEDTLTGFPVKQVVPALITLLSMDHNFDMMNNACRALTYMMEALPRSSAVVLDAVPAFLEKLQVIQCMDVAEQSLTALEMLSRRHSKAILQARGVSACLTYIDFFSIVAQRAALAVTANCCNNLHVDEFGFVSPSLPNLAKRLTQQDKKSVESICSVFCRLVESFQNEPDKLREIASDELLTNIQQLLVVSPPLISSGTFITVLRMLSTMCAHCSDLALTLLKLNIADTLCYLLTSSPTNKTQIELISRSPQELYEITCLIGELMPRLPTDGLFAVDSLLMLERGTAGGLAGSLVVGLSPGSGTDQAQQVVWQWKDDRGVWHAYSAVDTRLIESAHQAGEDELSLSTLGREYTLDFHSMQQINEHTGTTRAVSRRLMPAPPARTNNPPGVSSASQESLLSLNNNTSAALSSSNGAILAASFIRSLFSVLYEVYSSSAGPAVRCKCLRALLRMVYYAPPELLQEVLKNQVVSSHLAGMMASQDLRIVVGALQMAEILMQKLPQVFEVHFTREGVMHQIKQLTDPNVALAGSPPKHAPPTQQGLAHAVGPTAAGPSSSNNNNTTTSGFHQHHSHLHHVNLSTSFNNNDTTVNLRSPTDLRVSSSCSGTGTGSDPTASSTLLAAAAASSSKVSSPQIRLSDVLKRKRTSRTSLSRKSKHSQQSQPASASSSTESAASSSSGPGSSSLSMADLFSKATSGGSGGASSSGTATGSSGSGGSHIGTRSSSRSAKFAGATTNFLASLNPARWGRNTERAYHKDSAALAKCSSSSNLSAGNKEKARAWVRERAATFLGQYDRGAAAQWSSGGGMNILTRLTSAILKLDSQSDDPLSALTELRDIVLTSDISPFEVNHSGLVRSLLVYLTRPAPAGDSSAAPGPGTTAGDEQRHARIRKFLHVFAKCPLESNVIVDHKDTSGEPLGALIAKLNGCVSQLEQLPVKVHDLPAGTGSTTALKFFNTHQLKCHLQRHPSCTSLKQWKGGTVKIDPLALVQAIERYLVVRGYARIRDKDSGESDEDNSEEDIDDTLAAVVISQGARHKLQFLIGDHPLPYNMTVYQAIRQFSPAAQGGENGGTGGNGCETESESEAPLGSASVWVQSHTIYYRPVLEETSSSSGVGERDQSSSQNSNPANAAPGTSSGTGTAPSGVSSRKQGKSSSGKSSSKRKADEIWSDGLVPLSRSPLDPYLSDSLPPSVTITDACLPVLTLLRVLNAINRSWGSLYIPIHNPPLLPPATFVNGKICAKASRQLQDPLVIMTGNLPHWLQQLATTCPFLLNFEIRQLLLYASSFDRDRALQRLVDSAPEINNHSDTQERVTPRLDRRKRTVSRTDILKQAESLLSDLAQSKALLEIQYENEVGTGLGPTLEFYALVSKELQRTDLELWHPGNEVEPGSSHVTTLHGLYPGPIAKSTKLSHLVRLKSKFRFLGKFMAKAVMDSRMLDLPLCVTFYKWLLGQESYLSLADLACIAPEVYRTLARFQPILIEKAKLESNPSLSPEEKEDLVSRLALDGCVIEDLGLDFTLPGHSHVELRKDGRDISVTIHNLAQYCKLVVHWYLNEGIARQMESFREGFECVFPLAQLSMFYPEELENVFCGSGVSSWDMKTLMECCRIDHGYNHNSKAIKYLFHVLSCYNAPEQRDFLQFVTGSPRLPVGGFRALSPPLTIVRKTFEPEASADGFLPSVMTCVNYLKLPDYSSIEVMQAKLRMAAQEGQNSFHLS
uniref:E3 ubiquitin-protein ligase n=1 Tax=Cacopsylla melanoneura TaxID=428564 RepID=A0A8D8MAI1_9HEMI